MGRYEGDFKWGLANGRGVWTCQGAKGVFSWEYSGDFENFRPTKGELVEADGRRFEVTYDKGCGLIYKEPKPKTKVSVLCGAAALALPAVHACVRGSGHVRCFCVGSLVVDMLLTECVCGE